MSENMVLRMENVTMQFGGVVAVNNLSLQLREKIRTILFPCFHHGWFFTEHSFTGTWRIN